MAQNWYEAPEVAPQHCLPEVYYPAPAQNFTSVPLHPINPFNDATTLVDSPKSPYPGTNSTQHYNYQPTSSVLPPTEHPREAPREAPRRFCGCSALVLVLSAIIAALSIAVIGLAAGTGVQANRANNAESKLAAYANSSNITIDRGCSSNPDSVSATQYTSAFFNRPSFRIYCNSNAPNPPLQSLFVGNFDDCIDACAFYSAYTAGNFPNISTSANFTCSGVTFITSWTNRTNAQAVNAPGNCYLKPGPQNTTALTRPDDAGVHAAILQ
ncbi:hypothetical protein F5X98DRAFT_84046 [Xylaria grammica]|nr:hypothetical protein F5X98DRAFT_84046 [Xylaria grammica]